MSEPRESARSEASASREHPESIGPCDPQTTMPHYVVGIGASAGGLKPLEELFQGIPSNTGAAFVVVQHLSPDFKSLMKELLARHTGMEIARVEDGMNCDPNTIYLIPPKKNMALQDRRFRLFDQDLSVGHAPHFAIDSFFQSLSQDVGGESVGVILSGTGTDGSRGVSAINEVGGLVLVQAPQTAQFDGMPRSAIQTGNAHAILSPAQIATSLQAYLTQRGGGATEDALFPGVTEGDVIAEVTAILKAKQGVDFSHYRTSTISRRLSRRIAISGFASLEGYLGMLGESPQEQEALRDDLLIGVTRFFRDPEVWAYLKDEIIGPLVAEKDPSESMRVWTTACSSGEEVYTMTMLLLEEFARQGKDIDLKVFATDIDRRALQRGAAGLYPMSVANDVGEQRLSRFFTQERDGFRVSRQLRESVIFAEHNLTRDAPFTKMDLISCRNALIYMEPMLQESVLRMLHFALRVRGVLLLGSAETVGGLDTEFTASHKKWKVFRKRRDVVLNRDGRRQTLGLASPVTVLRPERAAPRSRPVLDVVERAFRAHLRRFNSTCVIVDQKGNLLHTLGQSEPFLHVPEGQGTSDVTRMVHEGLSIPLNAAIQRACGQGKPVEFSGIGVGDLRVRLDAIPSSSAEGEVEFIIILLTEEQKETPSKAPSFDLDEVARERILSLENELRHSRENLQATIEELETTNEEHQATNEELLASNEELQSTNEELQSVNEELFTVNAEYQLKIQELTNLNNDMDNLLRTAHVGTIFLDRDLKVRSVTSRASEIVHVSDKDVDRRIDHFSHRTDCEDLFQVIAAVAKDGEERERAVRNDTGSEFFMRFLPYRKEDGSQDGVVITIMGAEELQSALDAVKARRRPTEQEGSAQS